MAVEKAEGIVIKTFEAGESSRRIKLLCKGLGKITVFAKGAKNTKSRLLSACQPFTYGEYMLYEGRDFYSLTQAEIKNGFYGIRNDLKSLAYASYLAELTEKTVPEGMENDDLLRLLYMAYEVLSEGKNDAALVSAVFEIKYLQLSGLLSAESFCTCCGREEQKMSFFSCESGGFICSKCAEKVFDSIRLSDGATMAVKHVLENYGRKIFAFKVSDSVKKELSETFEAFIKTHMCDNLKTLDFAKECDLL